MLNPTTVYRSASRHWRRLPPGVRKAGLQLVKSISGEDYQRIAFQDKVYRRGTNRAKSYRQLFPEPPRGATILDVGANLGYYSLRAVEEGALYCRALDLEAENVAFLRCVADDLGFANLDVLQADVELYEIERDFDIVMCLNVVHHFPRLDIAEGVIDKLYRRSREKLVLIVLAPDDPGLDHSMDTTPDPLGGKPFLRIAPDHIAGLFSHVKVDIAPAVTYGPNRFAITISK